MLETQHKIITASNFLILIIIDLKQFFCTTLNRFNEFGFFIYIYLLVELLRLNSHSHLIRPMLSTPLWFALLGGQRMCVFNVLYGAT